MMSSVHAYSDKGPPETARRKNAASRIPSLLLYDRPRLQGDWPAPDPADCADRRIYSWFSVKFTSTVVRTSTGSPFSNVGL
jgi:hypothetical protein